MIVDDGGDLAVSASLGSGSGRIGPIGIAWRCLLYPMYGFLFSAARMILLAMSVFGDEHDLW